MQKSVTKFKLKKSEIPLALDGGMNDIFEEIKHRQMKKNKNRHKYLLQYHLIFVCKYRKKLLIKSIADDVKQLSYEICNKHNVTIKEMKTDKDHNFYQNIFGRNIHYGLTDILFVLLEMLAKRH